MVQARMQRQWALPKNVMRFLYADGFLPVARTHLRLVALGKKSSTGSRKAVANSTLDWDIEMSDASFRTGGGGEIELDDPALLPGYEQLRQEILSNHPNLRSWQGVPGQPTPQFSGGVTPSLTSDYTYPNVPLTLELRDPGMTPPALSYDMRAGTVVTSWSRPPLASFDQNDFFDPSEYLDNLSQRYSFLSNLRVPDLSIDLIRLGAPVLELAFVELQRQFAKGNLKTSAGTLQEDQLMKRVCSVLMRELRIPGAQKPSGVFLDALRTLAVWPSLNPLAGPPTSLNKGIMDALGASPAVVSIPTAAEDWAALGTLVFYIGSIAFQYRWDPSPTP